jgi:hypothetical protein
MWLSDDNIHQPRWMAGGDVLPGFLCRQTVSLLYKILADTQILDHQSLETICAANGDVGDKVTGQEAIAAAITGKAARAWSMTGSYLVGNPPRPL